MPCSVIEIFQDHKLTRKIQTRLPYLFQLAEIESSRGGKIGMEIGSAREKILVALLIYKFGDENVETHLPITASGVDVILCEEPVSIKTITGRNLSSVKIIWTVDPGKAEEFFRKYYPACHILLVQVIWGDKGGFYYIPLNAQKEVFEEIGRGNYIKLPKQGTNPRGVEISRHALIKLINHPETKKIDILWDRPQIDLNIYKKWIELWHED